MNIYAKKKRKYLHLIDQFSLIPSKTNQTTQPDGAMIDVVNVGSVTNSFSFKISFKIGLQRCVVELFPIKGMTSRWNIISGYVDPDTLIEIGHALKKIEELLLNKIK